MDRQTAAGFPHGRRLLHTKPSGFIEIAEPRHHALPRPCGSPMRFHERPIRCASSIFLLEILSDKHSRGWYRRISHPPDTEFSLHHVSTSQTRTFSNSRFKNTPIYFPAVTDFFTSGEVGLDHTKLTCLCEGLEQRLTGVNPHRVITQCPRSRDCPHPYRLAARDEISRNTGTCRTVRPRHSARASGETCEPVELCCAVHPGEPRFLVVPGAHNRNEPRSPAKTCCIPPGDLLPVTRFRCQSHPHSV